MSRFMAIDEMWGNDASSSFTEARDALVAAARGIGKGAVGQEILTQLGEAVAIPQEATLRVQRFGGTPLRDDAGRAVDASADQVAAFVSREYLEAKAQVAAIISETVPALYGELEAAAEATLLGPTDVRAGDEPLWAILAKRLEESDGSVLEMARIAVSDPDALRLLQGRYADLWLLANDPKEEGATFKTAFRRFVLQQLVLADPTSPGAKALAVTGDLIGMANGAAGAGLTQLLGSQRSAAPSGVQ